MNVNVNNIQFNHRNTRSKHWTLQPNEEDFQNKSSEQSLFRFWPTTITRSFPRWSVWYECKTSRSGHYQGRDIYMNRCAVTGARYQV